MISVEDCVQNDENNLGLYVWDSDEELLKGVEAVGIIDTENLLEKEEFKRISQSMTKTKRQDKRMYQQFVRDIS